MIDISKVDIGILNSTLLYSIKLPLLEADQCSVQHLIPIPIKNGKSFLASLPDHEFLFLNDQKTLYVPADKESIKECKLIDTHRICKRTQPTHLLSESYTCETQIIGNSITSLSDKICQFSPFKIKDLVYVPLYSDGSYVFIPEKEQELNIVCRNFSKTKLISTANLVHSNDRCIITTDILIIKTDKSVEYHSYIKYNKSIITPFNVNDFDLLESSLLPLQHSIDPIDLKSFGQSLDDLQNMLEKVKRNHRSHTWMETSSTVLTYLGYTS